MPIVYIGLGSNLQHPQQQIENALIVLSGLENIHLLRSSQLYRSAPWGNLDQPEFVNAVAEIQTELSPSLLLAELLAIEHQFGRERTAARWGPRTLDLDILLYDMEVIDGPELKIPHPHLHERSFVLFPLNELSPQLEIPGHGAISGLLPNVDHSNCMLMQM